MGVAPTGKVADLHKYKDANGGNDPWMDTVWGGYDDSTIQKWFSKPDLYPGEAKHSHWYGMKFGEYFGFTTLGTGGSIGKEVTLTISQLPPHSHEMSVWYGGHQAGYGPKASSTAPDSSRVAVTTTKNTGNGNPIRVLPPYHTVYIWQRTN